MSQRYTKDNLPQSFGTLKPVGYVMVGLPSAESAAQAADALGQAGFAQEDILYFTPSETAQEIQERLDNSSGAAGFGYEITLMRRYLALAQQGYRWLLVYAPEDEQAEKVSQTVEHFGAAVAVKYNRLTVEDLI